MSTARCANSDHLIDFSAVSVLSLMGQNREDIETLRRVLQMCAYIVELSVKTDLFEDFTTYELENITAIRETKTLKHLRLVLMLVHPTDNKVVSWDEAYVVTQLMLKRTVEEQKLAKIFNAADADIVFFSSDHVLFRIHSVYLNDSTSRGFPELSSHVVIDTEPIPLQEESDVIDLLFQFIEAPAESQNYQQPRIFRCPSKDDAELFFRSAEAAEKYVVYSATNACVKHMEYVHELLSFHDYSDLADQAAKHALCMGLDRVAAKQNAPGFD
ncbi:hypothetical protein BDN70DRAFT_938607 [Pholiota conissans]|uniref:BTB domain-containing protein n=1 Tax=Pholiota conissans TaxID=109636 RepID=A0A9P5YL82_9AGAR|nr:hypothetical protein BDN70DRAFT_938607 [Pholiota conissans]